MSVNGTEYDEIPRQMMGLPGNSEVNPVTIQIPDVPAPSVLKPAGEPPMTWPIPPGISSEVDFFSTQAVVPTLDGVRAPDSPVVILSPDQLEALNTQANSATSTMSGDDRAFWDKKSGKTQAAQPTQISSSPDQNPRLRDALGTAREHGREIRGETSVFARLIRAKDRAKQALSGVTDLLIRKGYSINNNITDAHDLYVGLKDDPEIRKKVAEAAVKATQEVIDVPFAFAGDRLEAMLTVKIRIGDKEYVPIDEMIKTAEAVESGIKNTVVGAKELARKTARGIKDRIEDTRDVARIAHNVALAKLVENRADDKDRLRRYMEGAQDVSYLVQMALQRLDSFGDKLASKANRDAIDLERMSVGKRKEAFGLFQKLVARKDAIFGIRQLAEAPQAKTITPQVDAVMTSEEPVTSSKDPRYASLSLDDQFRIAQKEYRAEYSQATPPEAPTPTPSDQSLDSDRHPLHPNNTIL